MTHLSEEDEARIQAIIDEVRLATEDDPYIHLVRRVGADCRDRWHLPH